MGEVRKEIETIADEVLDDKLQSSAKTIFDSVEELVRIEIKEHEKREHAETLGKQAEQLVLAVLKPILKRENRMWVVIIISVLGYVLRPLLPDVDILEIIMILIRLMEANA